MNIFKLSDEEFEKYLTEKIDNIDPDGLLQKLISCGLTVSEEEEFECW